jgi:hypothetical protein
VRKALLIILAIAGAAAAAAAWWPAARSVSVAPEVAPSAPAAQPAPSSNLGAWPARDSIGKPRGELFGAPPAVPAPAAAPPQAPAAPVAPPLPYRVAGSVVRGGVSELLLVKGDVVLPVKEGDTLDGGYRVESIGPTEITLVYLPLGVRERLPLPPAETTPRRVP